MNIVESDTASSNKFMQGGLIYRTYNAVCPHIFYELYIDPLITSNTHTHTHMCVYIYIYIYGLVNYCVQIQ